MNAIIFALTLLSSPIQLENSILSTQSGWVSYSVPLARPNARLCCGWDSHSDGCSLEESDSFSVNRERADTNRKLVLFLRVRSGRVDRIRAFSSDCDIDTTGTNVRWLGEAEIDESVDSLARLIERDTNDSIGKKAMAALSFHAGDRAVRELVAIAKRDASSKNRGHALFWLAQRAGREAADALTDAVDNDPDTDVKKKAVFAISQLPKDQSIPILMRLAKTHKNREVRKKALFWLGQTNDPRAVEFIEELLLK